MIKFVAMTPNRNNIVSLKAFWLLLLACLILSAPLSAQNRKRSTGIQVIVNIIDSLQSINYDLETKLQNSDSLLDVEKLTSAELRDQILELEEYKKSLEANKIDVEGENLKLNQSNRILIIFNSVVAVLLVITLVFVLKRAGKKQPRVTVSSAIPSRPPQPAQMQMPTQTNKMASFEDKLSQLEKLGSLKEKGILSDEEFQSEKQKVLGK